MKSQIMQYIKDATNDVQAALTMVKAGEFLSEEEATALVVLMNKIHILRDESIRYDVKSGESKKDVGEKYCVSSARISQIINAVPEEEIADKFGEVISGATNIDTKGRLLELGMSALTDIRGVRIVEAMRNKLARLFGVTVMGTSVTVRFSEGTSLQEVSMQIVSIIDSGIEEPDWGNN